MHAETERDWRRRMPNHVHVPVRTPATQTLTRANCGGSWWLFMRVDVPRAFRANTKVNKYETMIALDMSFSFFHYRFLCAFVQRLSQTKCYLCWCRSGRLFLLRASSIPPWRWS